MAVQGTVLLDFGAFPGVSDASVFVSSPTIGAGNLVEAWIFPAATADHTADEHMVETIKVFAGNIVAASGFTVYGFNTSQINEPVQSDGLRGRFSGTGAAAGRGRQEPGNMVDFAGGGEGTLIYGKWNIGWVWN